MTGQYEQIRASALAMLERKGTVVTITRRPTLKNEITGKLATGAPLTAKFACVALPAGPTAEKFVGSLVGKRTLQFYLSRQPGSGGGLDPMPGDRIRWSGLDYTLQWTQQYDPDNSGALLTVALGQA